MQRALALFETSIGKKAVMAVTGLVMYGFVVGHLLGNLQVYMGPEQLNGYAVKLRELGPLLWSVRVTLLLSLVLHIWATLSLYYRNTWGARPVRYEVREMTATNYAARTMWLGGPLILLFVIYHVAEFTFPGISMGAHEFNGRGDVYFNVVNDFSVPWVVLVYIAAQIMLGLHLYHGGWSLLQTLGLTHPSINDRRRTFAQAIAALIVIGNISIPVAVLAGYVTY